MPAELHIESSPAIARYYDQATGESPTLKRMNDYDVSVVPFLPAVYTSSRMCFSLSSSLTFYSFRSRSSIVYGGLLSNGGGAGAE